MRSENSNLKRSLVLHSFTHLFLLLVIKHLDIKLYLRLICRFFAIWDEKRIRAFGIAINHTSFGSFVIALISIAWLAILVMVAIGFRGMQKAVFQSTGEIKDVPNDSGATF